MGIIFSTIAGLAFGVTMFFRKLSVKEIGVSGFIFEVLVETILALILVWIIFPFNLSKVAEKPWGIVFGVFSGISVCIGVIAFFLAVKYGSALLPAIISPVLSAIVASLLTILILHETVTVQKIIGLIVTLVGLFIFLKY